ncbi:MAG: hypothetical protein IPK99_06390 [Flavobacteriales bacterium]|nr:hypothetical protein [Flavobacteriales bacterium]
MKTLLHTLTIALLFVGTTTTAQEVSKVFGFSKPFPNTLEKGDCGSNMGLAPGMRVTMPVGDRFGVGFGLAHEWRSVLTEQETESGNVPLSEVKGPCLSAAGNGPVPDLHLCKQVPEQLGRDGRC